MPGKVDEVKWNRAKAIVRGQKGGVNNKYALVNHIYQNMGGTFHNTRKSLGENTMGSQYEKIMNDHKLTHQDLVKSMLAEVAGESALEKSFESQSMRYGRAAINYAKTKTYRNKMLQRGEEFAIRGMPHHIKTKLSKPGGAEKSLKEIGRLAQQYGPSKKNMSRWAREMPKKLTPQMKRKMRINAKVMGRGAGYDVSPLFRTNKLDSINDMLKGVASKAIGHTVGRVLGRTTGAVNRMGSGLENLGGRMYNARVARSGVSGAKNFAERGMARIGGAMRTATPRQVAIGAGVAGAGAAGAYGLHRARQNRRQG